MLEIYNICFYVHIDKTDDLYDVLTEFGFYMSPNTLKWQNQMWRLYIIVMTSLSESFKIIFQLLCLFSGSCFMLISVLLEELWQ